MRVIAGLLLTAVFVFFLACQASPTPAAPTPDIPATVEAILHEALATPEPTREPLSSPTPGPGVIPTASPAEAGVNGPLVGQNILKHIEAIGPLETAVPGPTLRVWTIPTPRPTLPMVLPPTPLPLLPTLSPTERPAATTRTRVVTPTSVPTTATPTVPMAAPTLVPVETASKVARTIQTSLGRRVDITVQGFSDNRLRFDQLVAVINKEEQLLGMPFPAPKVNMRRVSQLPGNFCGHNQMSYESRFRGDPYIVEASVIRLRMDGKCDDTFGSIAHEVAHTWFHGNDPQDWIDEGLANSIEYQVEEAYPGQGERYPPVTYCSSYRNISELESATPDQDTIAEASGFSCNYRLGDGIFDALRKYYGTQEFNRRIAKLARRSVNETDKANTIEYVREVLGSGQASHEIIDLWYQGEPEMRIFRHLDQVTFTHPPTVDGEFIHFAGRTQQPAMVHDFVLGDDPYCPQFHLYQGLADPEYVASISDPLPVGWHHNAIPKLVVINSEVNPATGSFKVTARVNDLSVLSGKNLSLQIGSRVTTGADGKCEEDSHLSQIEIGRDKLDDELKEVRYYHQKSVLWAHPPRVKDYSLPLAGVAPSGTLSFEWRAGSCSQILLYEFDALGYTYVATVYPMLPEGRSWNTVPEAEFAQAIIYSDGRFEAVIEIWDQSLLSHDHLVLVVRSESSKDSSNTCWTEEVMGATRLN